MEEHIGQIIQKKLEESGMSKAEFGRRIGISRQNVQHVLSRANQDTDLLFQICKTLKHDFFQYYSQSLQLDHAPTTKSKKSDAETDQRIDGLKREMDQMRKDMQVLLKLIENRNEAIKKRKSN